MSNNCFFSWLFLRFLDFFGLEFLEHCAFFRLFVDFLAIGDIPKFFSHFELINFFRAKENVDIILSYILSPRENPLSAIVRKIKIWKKNIILQKNQI